MRVEEFREALQELAGEPPAPDATYPRVVRTARRRKRRARLLSGGCVVVVAIVAVAAAMNAGTSHERVKVNGSPSSRLTTTNWTREPAPPMVVTRIAMVDSRTFALGSTGGPGGTRGVGAILEVKPSGASSQVLTTASGGNQNRLPAITDMAATSQALVAVGQGVAFPNGEVGAAAWYSNDDGRSWRSAAVEQPAGLPTAVPAEWRLPLTTIGRVLLVGGFLYAFGSSWSTFSAPGGVVPEVCQSLVWSSKDATSWALVHASAMPTCSRFGDAADGPGGIVAVTQAGSIVSSRDGVRWEQRAPAGDPLVGVAGLAGSATGYVAVGLDPSTAAIWWSPDAITWTRVLRTTAPAVTGTAREAAFTGVAYDADGWLAVGWRIHAGEGEPFTDAMLWTSTDGQRWTPSQRSEDNFEQFAYAGGVAASSVGAVIFGQANIRGTGAPKNPAFEDPVLWRSR
jgi:hypothetical protein